MAEPGANQGAVTGSSDPGRRANEGAQASGATNAPPAPAPRPPSSRSAVKSAPFALSLAGLVLAAATLWLLAWSLGRPDSRNSPERLLARSTGAAAIDLPPLPELHTNLSTGDLEFGELQVERMVRDRPEMTRYVAKGDSLWQFCARAFAGEVIGERIFWEGSLPAGSEYQSDHRDPYQGEKGYIRIRKEYGSGYLQGTLLPCEELWSCAVFEFENLRNHNAFTALFERGLEGELSREEWIRQHTRLEYEALRRTAAQYQKLWRPEAEKRGIWTSGQYWGADIPTNYESWISLYRDPGSYPWDVYGRWYDREILPYVRRNRH